MFRTISGATHNEVWRFSCHLRPQISVIPKKRLPNAADLLLQFNLVDNNPYGQCAISLVT